MYLETSVFPEYMQEDEEELEEIFEDKDSIGLLLEENKKPIGYAVALPLENCEVYDIESDPQFENYNTLYLESIAVLPEYQGKGCGSKLFNGLSKIAKEKGYKRITLHARKENGFSKIIQGKNGRVLETYEEWLGDEEFDYLELKL